jgi:hypothetical protein
MNSYVLSERAKLSREGLRLRYRYDSQTDQLRLVKPSRVCPGPETLRTKACSCIDRPFLPVRSLSDPIRSWMGLGVLARSCPLLPRGEREGL